MAARYEIPALFGVAKPPQGADAGAAPAASRETEPEPPRPRPSGASTAAAPEADPESASAQGPAPDAAPDRGPGSEKASSEADGMVSPSMRFLSQLGEGDVSEEQVEAALSDFPSFRHADAEGSLEAVDGVPAVLAAERRVMRRRVGVALAAVVALALAALLVDSDGGLFSLDEVIACYGLAFQQFMASVAAPSDLLYDNEIVALHEGYFRVLAGVGAMVQAALCGAAAGIGGLLFQSAFRSRFAAAPIVGTSAAVLLGQGIAVLATGAMLEAGLIAPVVACVLGLVPVVALRFRLNGLVLPDDDARQLGIEAPRLRTLALACGAVLLVASQATVGLLFPLAIAAPPLARRLFGAEFRHALVGSALLGIAALLLALLLPFPTWLAACVLGVVAFVACFREGVRIRPLRRKPDRAGAWRPEGGE